MAALLGMNTTTVAETIPTEAKSNLILPSPEAIRIYEALTWQAQGAGASYDFLGWDSKTSISTQTEADEFPTSNYSTNKVTVTPAMLGDRGFVSDQSQLEGSKVTTESGMGKIVETVHNAIDKAVLSLFVTATNNSNNSGVNLDLDLFDDALAAFIAGQPNWPRVAFVGSANQIRDLRKAVRQSGNGGLITGAGLGVWNNLPIRGFVGMWQGVEVYQGNTTQLDASNDAGGFVSCAPLGTVTADGILPGSGLGLAVWGNGLFAEGRRIPERRGYDATVSIYCAMGRTAEHNVHGFYSKKAA